MSAYRKVLLGENLRKSSLFMPHQIMGFQMRKMSRKKRADKTNHVAFAHFACTTAYKQRFFQFHNEISSIGRYLWIKLSPSRPPYRRIPSNGISRRA